MAVMYCSTQTEHTAITSHLLGCIQEGSWALFDNLNTLSNLCTSWFNEYSNSIFQALRKRVSQVSLADGKEATLNQSFVLIATLSATSAIGTEGAEPAANPIPMQLRSTFRVIALMEPDMEMLIRAKCIQLNVKAPNILSVRLKTLYDLCHHGFMSETSKRQITAKNFTTAMRSVCDTRGRQNAETATAAPATATANHPITTGMGASDSRRSSIAGKETAMAAITPVTPPVTSKYNVAKLEILSNQSLPIKEIPRKNRLALVNYSRAEHTLIAHALIDYLAERLEPSNDAIMFRKYILLRC